MDLNKPSRIDHISMLKGDNTDWDIESLAREIESGCHQSLKRLEIQGIHIGNAHFTLAKAMASVGLPSLETLIFINVELGDLQLKEYGSALGSGKVPNLSSLNLSSNNIGNEGAKSLGLLIQSGKLKYLAKLGLSNNGITDEGVIALADSFQQGVANMLPNLTSVDLSYNPFWEEGLLSLAEVLQSGSLNSLKVLDVETWLLPSKIVATALVSSLRSNPCLTVDLKCDWSRFPELDRRRKQLIEGNYVVARLVSVPKVQAKFGKVYLCGNPEVGKTTLRRTLQRNFWTSLITWEGRPHKEKRTRGIDVSQVSSEGNIPITWQVWDMAGQEEFHMVHNAFFPDLAFTEGNATTFVVVCRSDNNNSIEQLEYWLRYLASSCGRTIQSPRHVFFVMNNIGGGREIHKHAQQWKLVLEGLRDKFQLHLKIQTDLFLVDVRKFQQVRGLKSRLLEHSRNFFTNKKVPKICHVIQKNLSVFCQGRESFPVLHWTEFVEQVQRIEEPWLEDTIEAATKYSNETGVLIYIDTEVVRLVVVDPNWFCKDIIGNVFLPQDMASSTEDLFRTQVDQATGSISISKFKKFFKSLDREWNDAQVDDLIAILLCLGLCYKGKDENVFIPALIAEKETPGDPWYLQTRVEDVGDQWVMGFSVNHQKGEVALAPISLWHRFQVDLAQTAKFNGQRRPDSDFVVDKYFVTFVVDYMNVLIIVDANRDKPTFEEISILVKPMFQREELDAAERKQLQVDLADDLVERFLKLWNQVCPGLDYEQMVIWPWPASYSRPKGELERKVGVAQVKEWVKEHGVGRKMQWTVGSGVSITEDQLLSSKTKRDLGIFSSSRTFLPTKMIRPFKIFSSSRTSGINGSMRQVNDSVYELYKPENTPKIQVIFFHGLQSGDYYDAHLSTWLSRDGSTIWPGTWLVEDIPGAHVLSISYSACLRYTSDGSLDIYLITKNLLADLLQVGVGQDYPVVLVGHSIGGLVIKELCSMAYDTLHRSQGSHKAKLEKFLKNIGGIFYYSTPHHGSGVPEVLANKISSPLLTYFETLSKDTARLTSHFDAMCEVQYKHWLFAGLGEALPTNLGSLKAGVVPKKYFVIPEASARGEYFNLVEDADHFSVCRPKSKRERSFSKLRDFVSQIQKVHEKPGINLLTYQNFADFDSDKTVRK